LHTEFIEDLFHLPLSQQSFAEFQQIEIIFQNAREKIHEGNYDMWSYICGNNIFTTNKAYNSMIGQQVV
jgi:hypothetical protein